MKKYSIGVDYGTLSARAVIIDLSSGCEVASDVFEYPHGVMSETFIDGTALPDAFALQHPDDYTDAIYTLIPKIMNKSGVDPESVVGIGIDFTSCTVVPMDKNMRPLCHSEKFKNRPHAYVKLWKHHAAQPYADVLTERFSGSEWIRKYGGKISSEWLLPKIMEILDKDAEVYCATEGFVEAADYIVYCLTGNIRKGMCMAGFKAMCSEYGSYVSNDDLLALDPRLSGLFETKVKGDIGYAGESAGNLLPDVAKKLGLTQNVAVSIAVIDAHAALPAAGIVDKGALMMIMGTSTCHIFMSDREELVDGICGVVKGGLIKGLYCYEAGQACVGDHFDWFVKNLVPEEYKADARERGINIHKYLREKASCLKPGQSGLLALDWWNGNRSILVDSQLTGMILGMTLSTKPEEIYRALIEATAFGTRVIIEALENAGIVIDSVIAAGGIAEKDEMMMGIYADVLGKSIKIAASSQAGATGSAMFGAVAGGAFESINDAAKVMSGLKDIIYEPNSENRKIYSQLYGEYKQLHDYFGMGENNVMKRLLKIKQQ